MKRVVVLLFFVWLFCGTVLAETISSEGDVEFEFTSNCSITKVQGVKFVVTKRSGSSTASYSNTDSEWKLISEGQFQIEGEANKPISISCQSPVTVSNSSSTATVTLSCRANQTTYPAAKDDGQSCSDAGLKLSSDGKMHISVFPVAVSLESADATGTYYGTYTITVEY